MKEFMSLLLGAERENDVVGLTNNMFALYMKGSSTNSQYQKGASSSDSSGVESSTVGKITLTPLPTFGSQQSVNQQPYFPDSLIGFAGIMEPPNDGFSRQSSAPSNYNGSQ